MCVYCAAHATTSRFFLSFSFLQIFSISNFFSSFFATLHARAPQFHPASVDFRNTFVNPSYVRLLLFLQGRELTTAELSASIAGLPRSHAEAVKQRVKTLNRTVAGRTGRNRHSRKPDIRDVFRHDADASSTGTRSRSATPDSLDSISGIGIEHQHHQHHWPNHHHHPHHHDDHHAATAAVASSVAIDGGDGTAMVGDANVERALNGCNNPEADVGHGGHQM